jgi:hypothetical protein
MVHEQIEEDFSFYASFFAALKLRASAFKERLKNEIKLV